jgi:hypothetical protein
VTIALDANGLPIGHKAAVVDAAREIADNINELPESVYHLNVTDAEWIASNAIARYLQTLKGAAR